MNFEKVKILVVGDLMLDRYWWGSVERISPEAPVPIVKLASTSVAAGGAANVAANITGLGASAILIGMTGTDSESAVLTSILDGIPNVDHRIVRSPSRPTTVKTRIIAHNQQVVRLDQELTSPITGSEADKLSESLRNALQQASAVVVSDYAKGLLTDEILAELISESRRLGKMLFVDPKGKDYKKYRGATVVTPNLHEASEACGLELDDAELVSHAGNRLLEDLQLDASLITEGANGMTLFERDGDTTHMPAEAKKVFDVTGAGDTVIATLATAAAGGSTLLESARLANVAAGIGVGQVGTTVVTREDLVSELESSKVSRS